MICLMVSQSPLFMATIILCTLIHRLKSIVVGFVVLITPHQPITEEVSEALSPEPWLPVSRFEDLLPSAIEETCSICLMEFEGEDEVTQLSKCGHVFHVHCIEKWLHRNNFTCPLCRSSFLHYVNHNHSDSHAKHDYARVDFNPHISSYLGYSWH